MTCDTLKRILGKTAIKDDVLVTLADALTKTFERYSINTPLRQAHFLAQVLHESGAFKYNKEIWGPTTAQKGYEGRKDLGNTGPGDGIKFKGRGLIQLTGRANYAAASKEFGEDFINNPVLLESYPYAALIAGWFWHKRGLNTYADADDVRTITKRINGGFNGLEDRLHWLTRAKIVLL